MRRAIDSALQAVSPQDEIIVVDDGSSDSTIKDLLPYKGRVRVIAADHRGAGATRNRGLVEAQGDLVAFLDSDDEWRPGHLKLHRAVHEALPEIVMSFSDLSAVDEEGKIHSHYLSEWHRDPRPWTEILGPAVSISGVPVHKGDMRLPQLLSYYVATFTMVARRSALPDFKWFAEDVPTYEDLECFGRLSFAGPCAYIDQETATQHGSALHRLTSVPNIQKAQSCIKIIERIWGKNHEFQQNHAESYAWRVRGLYALLGRWFIKEGRTSEAREALRKAGPGHWVYRLWAYLPGPIARALDRIWLAAKKSMLQPTQN